MNKSSCLITLVTDQQQRRLGSLRQLKFLVIGEVCTDVWIIGQVNRISPEAPVPILNVTATSKRHVSPGMSGNLKANLLSLGVASQNIEHVHQTAEIVKQRFIDERHETQIMRLDTEDEIFELIADKELFDKIKNVDAVIISDYDKGFLSYVAAAQICSCALENDVKIFVDTKKKDVSCYRDATFVKVNESEFSSIDLKSVTDNLVVTLGGRGAKYHGVVYDAEKRSVRDITGAGDVFLAALSINYMLTFDVAESIQFANTAAGLSVEKHGTAAISWKDL